MIGKTTQAVALWTILKQWRTNLSWGENVSHRVNMKKGAYKSQTLCNGFFLPNFNIIWRFFIVPTPTYINVLIMCLPAQLGPTIILSERFDMICFVDKYQYFKDYQGWFSKVQKIDSILDVWHHVIPIYIYIVDFGVTKPHTSS